MLFSYSNNITESSSDYLSSIRQQHTDVVFPERDTTIPNELRDYFYFIREVLNKYNNDRFFTIPKLNQVLELRMKSIHTHFAFYERSIAAESLVYLQDVFLTILSSRVSQIIPKSKLSLIERFSDSMQRSVNQVRMIIYERMAKALFNHQYDSEIASCKFNISVVTSTNYYVTNIIRDIQQFKVSISQLQKDSNIPATSIVTVWTIVIRNLMNSLVEGYSRVSKCTNEGRALMQLDFNTLSSKLVELLPNSVCRSSSTIPYAHRVRNYINGFYYSPADILTWIRENRNNYSEKQILSLVKIGPGKTVSWKSKRDLMYRAEEVLRNPNVIFPEDYTTKSPAVKLLTPEIDNSSYPSTPPVHSDTMRKSTSIWDLISGKSK
jgi:hypothetical protein